MQANFQHRRLSRERHSRCIRDRATKDAVAWNRMNKDNWLSLGTVRSRNTDEDNLLGRCTTSSNATGDHLSKDENDPTNFVPSSFYVRF